MVFRAGPTSPRDERGKNFWRKLLKLPETTISVGLDSDVDDGVNDYVNDDVDQGDGAEAPGGDDCVDDDDDDNDDQDDGNDDNYVDDDGNYTKNLHCNKCWDHPEYALTHHNIQRTATAALQGVRSLHLPV